ncbi:MAG: hypothetical protein DVB23_001161 [Verrucomicrobia bacterium]|jgi:hypothetical protein|nr:MAG: hypothetical protein DVB23_001161 [Verrucomicrobiota bacterium]
MKRGLIALLGLVSAHAEVPWQPVDPVPQRFPVERDGLGYPWQLTSAGSFYSSGGNVFDSANQLTIAGERFLTERVESRHGHHAFTGRCGPHWRVRREVWIDPERAAACHLEEVRNESDAVRPLSLQLSTRFRVPWRSWAAFGGKARISNALQPSAGAFLTFAPRDGDSDLFLLLGDGDGLEPVLQADGQDFGVRFECELAPGASLRLFHAMSQRRSMPGMPPEEEPFSGWFSSGRLQLPQVSGELRNFAQPAAFSGGTGGAVWRLRSGECRHITEPGREPLILTGALGTIRLAADEIASFDGRTWTTRDGYHFAAVAVPGQTLSAVVSPEGEIRIPVEELAGIRVPGEAKSVSGGLRLKNGDVWPGQPAKAPVEPESFVGWEIQGKVREVPRHWLMENRK